MTQRISASDYQALAREHWTEDQFLTEVVAAAISRGWLVFHPRPARTEKGWRTAGQGTPGGFPDLCLARAGTVLLRELKSERGQPTEKQESWLEASDGKVWRPSMWDQIIEELE